MLSVFEPRKKVSVIMASAPFALPRTVRSVAKAMLPAGARHWIRQQQALMLTQAQERAARRSVMMGVRAQNERGAPCPESVALLDEVIPLIRPDSPVLQTWFRDYAYGQRRRIAFDLDYLRTYFRPSDRILEVGATPLLLTASAQRMGFRVQGVDVAPERFQVTTTALGLEVAKCDIEREPLPFSDSTFDGIVFNELFEHLRINLIFTFGEVLRVLRPGGTLLISTPHMRCLEMLLNLAFTNRAYGNSGDVYTEFEKISKIGHMGHIREYTTFEVCEFLKKVGFTVKAIVYRGTYRQRWKRTVVRVIPSLRPFVTYIATR